MCENPPRFPHILFEFASDAIEDAASSEVAKVAKLLRRHPKLRIRIQGFAQPDAPSTIGEALAQARATSVRHELLRRLSDVAEFADEDPYEGVREDCDSPPWSAPWHTRSTRLVGTKLQALGRWGHSPRNRNFRSAQHAELRGMADDDARVGESDDDESDDDDDESDGLDAASASEVPSEASHSDGEDSDTSRSDDEVGGHDQLRRAEFTLVALA